MTILHETSTQRRARRTRHKLRQASPGKLRMSVYRSNMNLSVQVIDDTKGHTLASASTLEKAVANPGDEPVETLKTLKQITDQLLVRSANYRCVNCGFGARAHHWQCPSCKHWGSVKPLLNLLGS